MSELFTAEECQKILDVRFKQSNVKFISFDIALFSDMVEGLLGDHFKIKITYEVNGLPSTENFFVKSKPIKTSIQMEVVAEMNVYEREIFVYSVLLKEFEKYRCNLTFASKYYNCISDNTLILEDMLQRGYVLPEKQQVYNLDQCKCVLKALTLFHAAGFMLEEQKSKELGRRYRLNEEYPEIREEIFFSKKPLAQAWVKASFDGFLDLINLLPENEEFKQDFQKRLRNKKFGDIFFEQTNFRKTCTHGDLWANNILFSFENGVSKSCCLVDFQMCRYFYPAFDVLLVIYMNTDKKFRRTHLDNCLNFYYETLSTILKENKFDINEILPKEDFWYTLDLVEFEVKMQASALHTFAYLPPEVFKETVDSRGDFLKDLMYKDRKPVLRKSFMNDEKYREVVTEDLYELHSTLYK